MGKENLKATIVIAIIGVILISVIYFKPVNIERSYSGYMYAQNNDFGKTTEIKLVGKLKKKLSLNYVFTGTIEVEGIKENVILKRIWAKNNVFKTVGYSAFIENKNSKTGDYEVSGTLNTSNDFNEIIVKLSKVDIKYNGEYTICGPSSTRKEAESLLTKMKNIIKL